MSINDFNKLHGIDRIAGLRKGGGGPSGAPAMVDDALEKVEAIGRTLEDQPDRFRVHQAAQAMREALARGDMGAFDRAKAEAQQVADELTVRKAQRDRINNATRFHGRYAITDLAADRAKR